MNDAYVGTLSSYAYVLMCISHLQVRPVQMIVSVSRRGDAVRGSRECMRAPWRGL